MIEIEIGRRSINVHFCPNFPTLVSKLFPLGDPQKEWKHVILGVSHSLQHCFDSFRECSPWKCIPISLSVTHKHTHTHLPLLSISVCLSISLTHTHTQRIKSPRWIQPFFAIYFYLCRHLFSCLLWLDADEFFLHLSDPFASRKNILTS